MNVTKDRSLLLDAYIYSPEYRAENGEEWLMQMDSAGFAKPNDYTPQHGDDANVPKHAYWAEIQNFVIPQGKEEPSCCHKWTRCNAVLATTGDYTKNGYFRVCLPTPVYKMALSACTTEGGVCLAPEPKYSNPVHTTVFVKLRNWRQCAGEPGGSGTKYLLSVANQSNVEEMEVKALQATVKKSGHHISGTLQFRFSLVVHTPFGVQLDTLESVETGHKCVLNMVVTQFAAEDTIAVPQMDIGATSETCAAVMPKTNPNILAAVAAAGITLPAIAASAPSR